MKTARPADSLKTIILCLVLVLQAVDILAAGPDDNVEWNGISHVDFQDRRPLCPLSNESFSVRFRAYRDDLTGARVNLDDGGEITWITAAVVEQRGHYDIWEATVPVTASSTVSYYIELSDGADTDFVSVTGVSEGAPADGGWILDFDSLEHAPYGATLSTGGVVFKVWAPGATTCHVRGSFNGWDLGDQMVRTGEDFIKFVPGASAGDEYKYFFGPGSIWKPDARARAFNSGDNLNSIIEDPFGYHWQSGYFDTPRLDEMVVYQLHVGSFAGRNDPMGPVPHPSGYLDVAARASHLAELGVNAVMVNPVNEFPWDYSAGYNPITAWAPEWAYGSPDDFKAMVDSLHQQGIAVLLDIVWNHFSFDDNFMWYYDGTQFYFDDPAADTPWGAQADFDSDGVRSYYLQSAMHWLEEYRIDGFRMDATSYMNSEQGSGWSLMQELNDIMDNRYAGRVTVAEQLPDDSWVTRPVSLGGAGFDSQYYDHFTDRLREEILDAAFGDPEMYKISDIITGSGTYLSGENVFNYFELHDEAWPTSGGGRIIKVIDPSEPHDDEWARGRSKLAHGIVMLAQGVPAFLEGCEWLEDTDFGTDPENRIDWAKKVNYSEYFAYFQDLIAVKGDPAFRSGSPIEVHHLNESGNVIGFRRYHGESDFVVAANFSNNDYTGYRIGLPQDGYWRETLNSQSLIYGGSGQTNPGTLVPESISYDGFAQSVSISLPKMAFVVLEKGRVQTGDEEPGIPRFNRLGQNYPNPFNPSTNIVYSVASVGRVTVRIYDVRGGLVRTLVDEVMEAGSYSAVWDGRDDAGHESASGVYFCRMSAGSYAGVRKLVLVR